MTHDFALLLGYGLSALALVVELIALWRHRRTAQARLIDAAADDPDDETTAT